MKHEKNGESAFPFVDVTSRCEPCSGMSLRDYFAAKAMPIVFSEHFVEWSAIDGEVSSFVRYAYEIADAMLEERAK